MPCVIAARFDPVLRASHVVDRLASAPVARLRTEAVISRTQLVKMLLADGFRIARLPGGGVRPMTASRSTSRPKKPSRWSAHRLTPKIAMLPTILTVVVIYVGCLSWTVFVSFTDSQSIPGPDAFGVRTVDSPVPGLSLARRDGPHVRLRRLLRDRVLGFGLRARDLYRPARSRRRLLPHRHFLSPRPLIHRHR